MRGAVIITLVVVGGALVATPVVAEYLLMSNWQAQTARLLERPGTTTVNVARPEISIGLQLGCWAAGTLLAGTGGYLAVQHARLDELHSSRASAQPSSGDHT